MNRADFQAVSRMRVQEARALLEKECFPGAYYIVGYAVECALKVCIARQVRRFDFPDKKLAQDAYTHNLEQLVGLAGLGPDLAADRKTHEPLDRNWAIVKDWSESARYETGISEAQARDLFLACTGRNGILPWIKKRW